VPNAHPEEARSAVSKDAHPEEARSAPSTVLRTGVSKGDFTVYLITDRRETRGRPLLATVEAALRGGVRAVQLREKSLGTRELQDLALALRALTARFEARLLINDRIDVALTCEADGVHLPADSFSVEDARRLLGEDRLIGVSTHRADEVSAAGRAGADFAVFGPVFATPSKEAYGGPLGLEALGAAAAKAAMPVLAVGGIDESRVAAVRSRGAAGVAVIRAILAAEDPERAAASLVAAAAA
jgi:thiamine-phosphate pyrophosphorylase